MTTVAGRWAITCTPIRKSLKGYRPNPGAGGASIEFGSRSTNAGPSRNPGVTTFPIHLAPPTGTSRAVTCARIRRENLTRPLYISAGPWS